MNKKILVIYYSQTGQLKEIAQNLMKPFEGSKEYEVNYYNVQPVTDFPFPWSNAAFFGAFPESFQQIPVDIQPPPAHILQQDYDLIILAYQIWFLTPSISMNSFMKSEYATSLLIG